MDAESLDRTVSISASAKSTCPAMGVNVTFPPDFAPKVKRVVMSVPSLSNTRAVCPSLTATVITPPDTQAPSASTTDGVGVWTVGVVDGATLSKA